ncbi:uncharacterized protein LOC130788179 [Actinidia eriantha]|uniref:uncharacterized protein LOC130788179 n=1 Tax=Actinidia eriantha TaxID=165200 RepID=UPI00258F4096|nr:uncharacterized protein LOC130788179 [Actinidia eriantha]
MTRLTQKHVTDKWDADCKDSFQELKKRLISALILTLPMGEGGNVIFSDASLKGLGCVLMQNGKRVKADHQQPGGLLTSLLIPEWKWEHITMDFVIGLPCSSRGNDAIWVIVDCLTKSAHFLTMKIMHKLDTLANLYIKEIVRLHGMPVSIVSDRDPRLLGPQIVQETTKKIALIQQRMRTVQSHQKSYADKRRKDLEFSQGYHVFLKVYPSRGIIRFGKKGKLNPCYIEPFEILERIGPVAYRLALPPELANVHNVFHVSMLKKYVFDLSHAIEHQLLEIREDLSYVEQLVQILDQHDQVLCNKVIPLVRVLWRNHTMEEST